MSPRSPSPGGKHIPVQTVREWMQSEDPLLHHLAFHTVFGHPDTVDALGENERLELCLTFLERALSGCYGDTIPDGPYVNAHTVLGWLQALSRSGRPRDAETIAAIISMLERIARTGDDAARDVIVLGVLEHALEDAQLRRLFEAWADDLDLAPLYEEAARLAG